MTKILDSVFLSGNVCRMTEVGDNMLINGSIYDKETLTPKGLKNKYMEQHRNNYSLIMNKGIYLDNDTVSYNNSMQGGHDIEFSFRDKYDPTIIYLFDYRKHNVTVNDRGDGKTLYLFKYKEDPSSKELIFINKVNIALNHNSATDPDRGKASPDKYLMLTDKIYESETELAFNIIGMRHRYHISTDITHHGSYVIKINKETMTPSLLYKDEGLRTLITGIVETEDFAFSMSTYSKNGKYKIYKYNKNTKSHESTLPSAISMPESDTLYSKIVPTKAFSLGNNKYLAYTMLRELSEVKLVKMIFDLSEHGLSDDSNILEKEELVNINWGVSMLKNGDTNLLNSMNTTRDINLDENISNLITSASIITLEEIHDNDHDKEFIETLLSLDIENGIIKQFPLKDLYGLINKLFIHESNGKKYLTIYSYYEITSDSENGVDMGIWTFLISDSTYDLEFKSRVTISGSLRSCILLNDNNTIVTCDNNTVYQYNFNSVSESFEKVFHKSLNPIYVGVDSLNRIWTVNKQGDIFLDHLDLVKNITVEFSDKVYNYVGDAIESNILVNSIGFNGEKVESTILLELEGDVVFKNNNSRRIEVTTSDSLDTQVPILINGPGKIGVYPRILV